MGQHSSFMSAPSKTVLDLKRAGGFHLYTSSFCLQVNSNLFIGVSVRRGTSGTNWFGLDNCGKQ